MAPRHGYRALRRRAVLDLDGGGLAEEGRADRLEGAPSIRQALGLKAARRGETHAPGPPLEESCALEASEEAPVVVAGRGAQPLEDDLEGCVRGGIHGDRKWGDRFSYRKRFETHHLSAKGETSESKKEGDCQEGA